MKLSLLSTLILFVSTVALYGCSEPHVSVQDLQVRTDNLKYLTNSSKPFSGIATDKIPDSAGGYERKYKDGLKHGISLGWHNNGQLFWKVNYENGLRTGLEVSWHDNGQEWFERTYYNDRLHGYAISWNESGQILTEKIFHHGQLHGLSSDWNGEGRKILESHYQHGKLINNTTLKK